MGATEGRSRGGGKAREASLGLRPEAGGPKRLCPQVAAAQDAGHCPSFRRHSLQPLEQSEALSTDSAVPLPWASVSVKKGHHLEEWERGAGASPWESCVLGARMRSRHHPPPHPQLWAGGLLRGAHCHERSVTLRAYVSVHSLRAPQQLLWPGKPVLTPKSGGLVMGRAGLTPQWTHFFDFNPCVLLLLLQVNR